MLVWMDLEMTGLDPGRDVIVEIATLITDDDLEIVAEGPDLVVHQPPEAMQDMVPVVVDMHTRSGLLTAIAASTMSLADAGAQTLAFIKEHVPEARTVPLCGNSIGTDRRFLAKYLPEIEEYLHYRSVDVSTLKELTRRWYPGVLEAQPRKATTHRALDDIRESVAELRFYREHVFRPPGSVTVPPPPGPDRGMNVAVGDRNSLDVFPGSVVRCKPRPNPGMTTTEDLPMSTGTVQTQRLMASAGAARAYAWSITGAAASAITAKPRTNPVVKGDFIDLTHHPRPEEAPL